MTTVTKTPQVILAATQSSSYGTTKGTPAIDTGWIAISADGGNLGMSILNSATAPGAPGQMIAQWSPDNTFTKVYDLDGFGGDISGYVAGTDAGHNTCTRWIDPGIPYIRIRCYGHTTNPVTYAADFVGVTRA